MGGGQRRAPRAQCGGGTGHGPSADGLGAVKAGVSGARRAGGLSGYQAVTDNPRAAAVGSCGGAVVSPGCGGSPQHFEAYRVQPHGVLRESCLGPASPMMG